MTRMDVSTVACWLSYICSLFFPQGCFFFSFPFFPSTRSFGFYDLVLQRDYLKLALIIDECYLVEEESDVDDI